MKTAESLTQSLAPIALGLLLPLGSLAYSGCTKKDDPPPPLPSAAPANTPAAPLVLEVEDAGEDVSDADADAKKVGGGSSASMKKCCQAVSQNAESAPEPTKTYMKQLAAACFAAAGSGQGWSGGGFSCK